LYKDTAVGFDVIMFGSFEGEYLVHQLQRFVCGLRSALYQSRRGCLLTILFHLDSDFLNQSHP
jgi:hypothetical protein